MLPTSSTREGIHVSSSGPEEVMVIADCQNAQTAADLCARAIETVKSAGYPVRIPSGEVSTFYVAGRPN